jgi:phytoene desaturase
VVVIGSGVGGLTAAARLALADRRPLVLEAADRLGGRYSTIETGGFCVPTGAVLIEIPGPWYSVVNDLGIDAGYRIPDPGVRTRIRGKDISAGSATWEFLMKRVAKSAAGVAQALRRPDRSDTGDAEITLGAWARRHTRSTTVLTLFDALSRSIFTVNADEIPARTVLEYLRRTGGFKTFGFAPRGNRAIADAVAEEIERRGGEVRTGWRVTVISVSGEQVSGVTAIAPDGREHQLSADAVISNAGPVNTAQMVAGTPFAERFLERAREVQGTSIIAVTFSARSELLPKAPGSLMLTDCERLCSIANLTALCPELAPEGRTLYDAYAIPRPSIGGVFDVEHERALVDADLRKVVPRYQDAEIVHVKVMSGHDAPAMHCMLGRDADIRTPIANLLEVGDGVKPPGTVGTTAAAASGDLAAGVLLDLPTQVGTAQ